MSQAQVTLLREKLPEAVRGVISHRGDEVVLVARERLVEVITFLRDEPACAYKLLSQIAAVDLLTFESEKTGGGSIASAEVPAYNLGKVGPREPRFYVSYNLYSPAKKHRLRVRVEVRSDDCKVPSIHKLFHTADWWERYCWDMMGIEFTGHPKLERLLMYPEFVGHPLRKDYPIQKRQPLVQEHDFPDLVRGPGPGPGGANVPMSQTHVGRQNVDPNTYE
jgi:NADH-quinone oxidoreductase subunit C